MRFHFGGSSRRYGAFSGSGDGFLWGVHEFVPIGERQPGADIGGRVG